MASMMPTANRVPGRGAFARPSAIRTSCRVTAGWCLGDVAAREKPHPILVFFIFEAAGLPRFSAGAGDTRSIGEPN